MAEEKPKQPLTEYVVLIQRDPTKDIGVPGAVLWEPVRNQKAEHGKDGEVRVFKAAGRDAAIKAYRYDVPKGEPPHFGTFRAVSVTAWKGSSTFKPVQSELREVDEGL